jgi:sulfur carrier protein
VLSELKLIVNGDTIEVPDTLSTVEDLLNHFGLDGKVAIVELNQDILAKESHSNTALSDRDRIEIVHFVGGG